MLSYTVVRGFLCACPTVSDFLLFAISLGTSCLLIDTLSPWRRIYVLRYGHDARAVTRESV